MSENSSKQSSSKKYKRSVSYKIHLQVPGIGMDKQDVFKGGEEEDGAVVSDSRMYETMKAKDQDEASGKDITSLDDRDAP